MKNVLSFELEAGSSKIVDNKENWFATSITVSTGIDRNRYVTYANELESNGYMDIYYKMISYY